MLLYVQIAGDDLSDWIRQAIAEKLEREQQAGAWMAIAPILFQLVVKKEGDKYTALHSIR